MAVEWVDSKRRAWGEVLVSFSVRYSELLDSGTELEIDKFMKFLKQFLLLEHNEDGSHVIAAGTTLDQTHPYVTVGNVTGLTAERALTGTANQVTVTDNGANSTVQLAAPQNIHTGASPTFTGLTLSGLTASRLVSSNGSKAATSVADLASWVAGTTNRVTVANDGDGTITLSAPQDIHTAAGPTFATVNTGQGANELYAMNQDVETTDAPSFTGLTLTDNLTISTKNIITDTTTGTKIGTSASQKLGFFNVTPVVQQATIVDADGTLSDITTKFNTLLAQLEALGLNANA